MPKIVYNHPVIVIDMTGSRNLNQVYPLWSDTLLPRINKELLLILFWCRFLLFLFCSYRWPYILNVYTCSRKCSTFSVAIQVFRNLFWKNMPSIWANVNHVFEVSQGLFFVSLLSTRCAGDEVVVSILLSLVRSSSLARKIKLLTDITKLSIIKRLYFFKNLLHNVFI